MKAIKIIFTGGTIGSTLEEGVIRPDSKKPKALIQAFHEQYGVDLTRFADFDEPYTLLSEHLDGAHLFQLIEAVGNAVRHGGYRGILITHGTDTLQYAAAALGYAFGTCSVPIVLVSANYPIVDPRTNALKNLCGAIAWLRDCSAGGVWVSYKSEGVPIQIHRGTRLLAHPQGTDRIESVGNRPAGFYVDRVFCADEQYCEKADAIAPLYPTNGLPKPNILRIQPYPGMTYPTLTPHIQGVIHETYHSGTLNLKEAAPFFRQAQELGIPVYVTGTTEGAIYESARDFAQYGLRLLPGRSAIAAYMKLWLTLSCGRDPRDTMEAALGGDI